MNNLQRFRRISFIFCFPQLAFDKFSNVLSGYTDYRLRQPFFGGGNYVLFGDLVVVQSLSYVRLFATPWIAAHQASLFLSSWSLSKFMSIELVTLSNHVILCHLLLLLPSVFPSIRVFSSDSALHNRWPKYWSFSFSISPANEYSGLIPLGLTGLISLQSKGLSRILSSTTV